MTLVGEQGEWGCPQEDGVSMSGERAQEDMGDGPNQQTFPEATGALLQNGEKVKPGLLGVDF